MSTDAINATVNYTLNYTVLPPWCQKTREIEAIERELAALIGNQAHKIYQEQNNEERIYWVVTDSGLIEVKVEYLLSSHPDIIGEPARFELHLTPIHFEK